MPEVRARNDIAILISTRPSGSPLAVHAWTWHRHPCRIIVVRSCSPPSIILHTPRSYTWIQWHPIVTTISTSWIGTRHLKCRELRSLIHWRRALGSRQRIGAVRGCGTGHRRRRWDGIHRAGLGQVVEIIGATHLRILRDPLLSGFPANQRSSHRACDNGGCDDQNGSREIDPTAPLQMRDEQ